jgi:hypothetical protein
MIQTIVATLSVEIGNALVLNQVTALWMDLPYIRIFLFGLLFTCTVVATVITVIASAANISEYTFFSMSRIT